MRRNKGGHLAGEAEKKMAGKSSRPGTDLDKATARNISLPGETCSASLAEKTGQAKPMGKDIPWQKRGGDVPPLLLRLLGLLIFLGLWELLTLFFPPLVVSPIGRVCEKLLAIVQGRKFWSILSATVSRFLLGMLLGVGFGSILGILCGISPLAENLLYPFVRILQVVPPICWVVLALVWFGFNGKPSIFIVATASLPTLILNLTRGIHSVDPQLLEMGRLYHFSRKKQLLHILLPSIRPFFLSALSIVVGSGWKLVVMGEVLTTSTGIGGAITTARPNIEPDTIIAWAILLVLLCFGTEWLLLRLLPGRKEFNA